MKRILIIPFFYVAMFLIVASVIVVVSNLNNASGFGLFLLIAGFIGCALFAMFLGVNCFDITDNENFNYYVLHKNKVKIKYGICLYDIDEHGTLYDKDRNAIDQKHTIFLPNISFKFKKISKMKKSLIVSCSVAIFLFLMALKPFSDCTDLYNRSVMFRNNYAQKSSERKVFYDKMWKTYSQKYDIANLNSEMFTKITKLIMENRADGKQLSWKWLKENQNIPYSEFTKFYDKLFSFIEQQRDSYFALEKECMSISKQNNVMLEMFPNVLYNKILNLPKINYEAGFTSSKTDKVFSTHQENNIKDNM